jgi:HAD superfamily hydrolase (TIGR01549 family)
MLLLRDARGFIFDLDGTLLSLPVDWPQLRKKFAELAQREITSVFQTLTWLATEKPEMKPTLFSILDEYEIRAAPDATLYEGSREVLREVSEGGRIGLVTMQGRKVCEMLLQRFDLTNYFQGVLTREDSLDRGEQLEMALRSLAVPKERVVFVGDRLNDLNSARRVGVSFVFIRSREEGTGAEVVFHDMKSFMSALASDEN